MGILHTPFACHCSDVSCWEAPWQGSVHESTFWQHQRTERLKGTGNAVTSMGTAFVSSAPNTGSRSDSMAMRWAQDKEGSEMQSAGKQDNGAEEHHQQLRAAGSVAVRAL